MVSQGMRSVSGLLSCVKIKNLCFPSLFLNFIINVAAKDSNFEKANTANFFAHVVETEPLIDGHLDDPCWKVSPLVKDFLQRQPNEGARATELTEVRVCRNKNTLYVGVRCFDSKPNEIRAMVMQRDASVRGDDYFFILLDPYKRGRDGYYFRANANAAKGDGLISSDFSSFKMNWDTAWEVEAKIDSLGWTAEFAIPFRSVSFDPESNSWGIDFGRWFARNHERSKWTGYERERQWYSIEKTGIMKGMENLESGKGLDFNPYLTATHLRSHGSQDSNWESGFDLYYQWTPSLTATLTFNTDFAEAESDQRRLNLTRFPLFFPEKRNFFLRGAEEFSFAGLSQSPLPFHSRTIGLSENGQRIDVEGGLKIVGRQGPWGMGLLGMKLKNEEIGNGQVQVGRLTYDFKEESKIGAIFTHGDPQSSLNNQLAGIDLSLGDSDWFNEKSATLQTFAMLSKDELKGTGEVVGSKFSFPNYPFEFYADWLHTDSDFEPAMGFVRRTGCREISLKSSYTYRLQNHSLIEDLSIGVGFRRYDLLEGGLDNEKVDLKILEIKTREGDSLEFSIESEHIILADPFEIVDGIEIQRGEYRGIEFEFEWASSAKRPFYTEMEVKYGDYYGGKALKLESEMFYRPNRYARIELSGDYTNAEKLPENFEAWSALLGLRLTPTTKLSLNSIVQYDNLSELIGINNRIRYIIGSRNDLYFVFNKGYERKMGNFISFRTESIAKIGWTFLF